MSENSSIEWTDHTFNPWEGCQKVGPGCDHCYAETRNARFSGGTAVNWGPGAPRRRTSAANWRKPLQWNRDGTFYAIHRRRQRVFCASLADWLDNSVPIEWLADLLDTIRLTGNLDWLLLSKRIGNWIRRLEEARDHAFNFRRDELHQWIVAWLESGAPANVWLGSTVVNQEEADRDIPKLLSVPACVHFLSMEPLLGPVAIPDVFMKLLQVDGRECFYPDNAGMVNWVIVGGESGHGARPMHPDWARSLRDQCATAGVPFLFKQWGEWRPAILGEGAIGNQLKWADGSVSMRVGKKMAGRLLDGAQHDAFPEVLS